MISPPKEKAAAPSKETAANQNQMQAKPAAGNTGKQAIFEPSILADMRGRLPDYLTRTGIELRKKGNRFVGRCPMHEDAHPSFAVFGASHENCGCYPCDFQGDVFALAQWIGHASNFPEAVVHVASVLGVVLPLDQQGQPKPTAPAAKPKRKQEPPFILPKHEQDQIHLARLAFSDAFHNGDPIVQSIAESLGVTLEALRLASFGLSGLGLGSRAGRKPWLCYAYPQGIKWRNPDPEGKRFDFFIGKATAPWRMEWAIKPEIETVYLTEGESDALALISAGIEDNGKAATVASPGTSFESRWAKLFAGKHVVLCFDTDTAGQVATPKVAGMLKPYAASVKKWKGPKP